MKGSPMNENDMLTWGKQVLDELLFRAGRSVTDPDQPVHEVSPSLAFDITADEQDRTISISLPAVDGHEICLTIQLSADQAMIQ